MKPTAGAVYTVSKDITYRELKDQLLFLLPGDRFLYTMNPAGEFIWKSILKKQPLGTMILAFARKFGIDAEAAQRDVNAFIQTLAAKKIIVKQPTK